MEPVGLAVGVLGLASLFSSCLEAVDKVQNYKSFAVDSQASNAQLKAERLRFELWGQQVGFDRAKLSANHHQRLDNPRICSVVEDLFLLIKRVCESDDDPQCLSQAGAGSGREGLSSTIRAQSSRNSTKLKRRTGERVSQESVATDSGLASVPDSPTVPVDPALLDAYVSQGD